MFNLPVTDMLAVPMARQHNRCADLELKALECIEYYGAQRGIVLCQDYYDDWHECSAHNLQVIRHIFGVGGYFQNLNMGGGPEIRRLYRN